jgi:hypothetical protein
VGQAFYVVAIFDGATSTLLHGACCMAVRRCISRRLLQFTAGGSPAKKAHCRSGGSAEIREADGVNPDELEAMLRRVAERLRIARGGDESPEVD